MAQSTRIPIRIKFLLGMSLLMILSLSLFLYLAIQVFKEDKTTLIYDLNAGLVKTIGSELRTEFQRIEDKVKILAATGFSNQFMASFLNDDASLVSLNLYRYQSGRWIKSKSQISKAFLDLHDLKPQMLESKHLEWLGPTSAKTQKKKVASHLYGEKIPTLSLMFPVKGQSSQIIADITTERLIKLLQETGIASVALSDQDGNLILKRRPSQTMSKTLIKKAKSASVDLKLERYESEGSSFIGALTQIGFGNLLVLSEVEESQAFRAAKKLINDSLLYSLFIASLMLFISLWIARNITLPLQNLTQFATAFGPKSFGSTIEVKSRDEVADLANSMNLMSKNLDAQQKKLIEAERLSAVGQVARGTGHEFGNILQRIMGKVDIASAMSKDPQVKEHLEVALDAIDRAGIIVRNLQSFSKSEKKREVAPISKPIEQSLTLINHELRKQSIEIQKDFQSNSNIEADTRELGQVFLNLLINASYAMKEKGGALKIRTWDENGNVCCEFVDHGTGISEEVLPHIFEFAYTTKGDSGSGLGLAISKEIIESHGGTIEAGNHDAGGAYFKITLPISA